MYTSVLNVSHKYDMRYLKIFVYLSSTYSLFVLNMASEHDSRKVMKIDYWHSTCSLSLLTLATNMT